MGIGFSSHEREAKGCSNNTPFLFLPLAIIRLILLTFILAFGNLWRFVYVFSYTCNVLALQAFSKKLKPEEDTTLALTYQITLSLFLFLLTVLFDCFI